MSKRNIIRAGDVVLIASGIYEDYRVLDIVRAKIKFRLSDAKLKFLAERPDYDCRYSSWEVPFYEWLLNNGYAEPIPYAELHIGSDSNGPDAVLLGQIVRKAA